MPPSPQLQWPALPPGVEGAPLEFYKAQLAWVQEERKGLLAQHAAAMKLVGAFGTLGLRSLFLVNGGALVAVLALLGNVWAKDDRAAHVLAPRLWWAMGSFGAGLVVAFIAVATAYVAQVVFVELPARQGLGNFLRGTCIVLCAASLAGFGFGVWRGMSALAAGPPPVTVGGLLAEWVRTALEGG